MRRRRRQQRLRYISTEREAKEPIEWRWAALPRSEGKFGGFELTTALWGEVIFWHLDVVVFFWPWPVNQQLEPLLLFPKPNVFGKQSTRQLNHALKWELFADLMHLSVSPAHFTLCISVASARRPASHITICPPQYGSTIGAAPVAARKWSFKIPACAPERQAATADRIKLRKLKHNAPPQSNVWKSDFDCFCSIPPFNLQTANQPSAL